MITHLNEFNTLYISLTQYKHQNQRPHSQQNNPYFSGPSRTWKSQRATLSSLNVQWRHTPRPLLTGSGIVSLSRRHPNVRCRLMERLLNCRLMQFRPSSLGCINAWWKTRWARCGHYVTCPSEVCLWYFCFTIDADNFLVMLMYYKKWTSSIYG